MVKSEPRVTIKRYANRRFYDGVTGTYLTPEEIVAMAQVEDVVVQDAETGEDITDLVLATHRLH
jgi:polyhydroxyalkanoate synthesis regulator protein